MKIIEKNGYSIAVKDGDINIGGCVLALGNFDGVHIAHRQLLMRAIDIKNKIGASCVGAWSFEENPLAALTGNPPPFIQSAEKKAEMMLSCGMDFVILCRFAHFKDMAPHDFIENHLVGELGCVGVVCGFNFNFGKFGAGKPYMLCDRFGADAFEEVEEYKLDGVTVSSTAIRNMIIEGNVNDAARFLGEYFYIDTPIVNGKKLGRTISFPTANQHFIEGRVTPARGIYATRCTTEDNKQYVGVTNVGVRPTVDEHGVINAETHILDFNADIYGQKLKVEFIEYLRKEIKHASLDDLRAAISADAVRAKEIVGGLINNKEGGAYIET